MSAWERMTPEEREKATWWGHEKRRRWKALITDMVTQAKQDKRHPELRRLRSGRPNIVLGVCRRLQEHFGADEPFYLDCATLAEAMKIRPSAAYKYLKNLWEHDMIQKVSSGSYSSGEANRYLCPKRKATPASVRAGETGECGAGQQPDFQPVTSVPELTALPSISTAVQ